MDVSPREGGEWIKILPRCDPPDRSWSPFARNKNLKQTEQAAACIAAQVSSFRGGTWATKMRMTGLQEHISRNTFP